MNLPVTELDLSYVKADSGAAEPSHVWTRFPFTNLVLLLYILGNDPSPHLCLGLKGTVTQSTSLGMPRGCAWLDTGKAVLRNLLPNWEIHCEKPAAYTEQRNQVSETPERHACVSLSIKHGSPYLTRITTTTKKRLTGKDHSKAVGWDVWLVSF